ncbi:MAG: FtsX-like permease family protein, partial [Planctomycetes bacterium]|nr:FtsX-like permease family protein [Planctomycetota bacterium]
ASDLDALRAVLPPNALIAALEAEPARLAPAGDPVWLLESHGDIPRTRNLPLVAGEWPREMAAAAARGEADDLAAGATPIPVVIESGLARRLAAGGDALGLELAFAAAANGKPAQIRVPTPAETIAAPERRLGVAGVLVDESKQSTNAFGIEKKHLFTEQVHALLGEMGINMQRPPWLSSGNGIFLPAGFLAASRVHSIFLRCDPLAVAGVSARAQETLVARGRRPLVASNGVWSVLTRPELEGYLLLHDLFFWLYVAIGLIVMTNLLLLTGWRRRREIALRRTEGATRGDILRQFLWEGLLLALLGLALGVIAGMALAALRVGIDPSAALTVSFPWRATGDSAAILLGGALLAAAYPAWRASAHDPMLLFRGGGRA